MERKPGKKEGKTENRKGTLQKEGCHVGPKRSRGMKEIKGGGGNQKGKGGAFEFDYGLNESRVKSAFLLKKKAHQI